MDRLIPSSGERRAGSFFSLNRHGYKAPDRVLIERTFGQPEVGTIALMDPGNANVAVMRPEGDRAAIRVVVVDIRGRLPAGATAEAEQALLADLLAAHAASPREYLATRDAIARKHGVR
jgi:hypothetical protein